MVWFGLVWFEFDMFGLLFFVFFFVFLRRLFFFFISYNSSLDAFCLHVVRIFTKHASKAAARSRSRSTIYNNNTKNANDHIKFIQMHLCDRYHVPNAPKTKRLPIPDATVRIEIPKIHDSSHYLPFLSLSLSLLHFSFCFEYSAYGRAKTSAQWKWWGHNNFELNEIVNIALEFEILNIWSPQKYAINMWVFVIVCSQQTPYLPKSIHLTHNLNKQIEKTYIDSVNMLCIRTRNKWFHSDRNFDLKEESGRQDVQEIISFAYDEIPFQLQ